MYRWHAIVENPDAALEKDLPKERVIVKVPVLCIGQDEDPIYIAADLLDVFDFFMQPYFKQIRQCGHWVPLERPQQVILLVKRWINDYKASLHKQN